MFHQLANAIIAVREDIGKKIPTRKKKRRSSNSRSGRTRDFTFLAKDTACMAGMGWIIDWGASQHLSHDHMKFLTYKNVTPGQTIMIADGTKIHAHGIGDIKVLTESGEIMLTEVWHVPHIGASLISVARMVDAGYKVEFEKSKCYVRNHGIRSEIGSRHGSLYYLAPNIESLGQNGNHPSGPQANLGLTTNGPQARHSKPGTEDSVIEHYILHLSGTFQGRLPI